MTDRFDDVGEMIDDRRVVEDGEGSRSGRVDYGIPAEIPIFEKFMSHYGIRVLHKVNVRHAQFRE